jgi:hypothetical protein
VRRLFTLLWGGALLYATEKEQDDDEYRSEAAEFFMASVESMIKLLIEFEHATMGVDIGSKLQRLEGGVVQTMNSFATEIGDKAKGWAGLPGTGGGVSYGRGAAGASSGSYTRRPNMADQLREAISISAAGFTSMMQQQSAPTIAATPQLSAQQQAAPAYQVALAIAATLPAVRHDETAGSACILLVPEGRPRRDDMPG